MSIQNLVKTPLGVIPLCFVFLGSSGCKTLNKQSAFMNTQSKHALQPVQLVDGGLYYGPLEQGVIQGTGEIRWPNNTQYEGEFERGQMHGQGLLLLECGYYDGQFRYGQFHGLGKYSCDDLYYEGEFISGKPYGTGVLTLQNVGVLSGQFIQGSPDGQIQANFFADGIYSGGSYQGEFKKGVMHGLGTRLYPDGSQYHGSFKAGLPEGTGRITWNNRGWYEGHFSQGVPQGTGACQLKGQLGHCHFESGILLDFTPNHLTQPDKGSSTLTPRGC
jgi:hypothetical protein